MERKISGYIKFKDKKAITRPLDGEQGEVKTWEISDNHNSKEFFKYNSIHSFDLGFRLII